MDNVKDSVIILACVVFVVVVILTWLMEDH